MLYLKEIAEQYGIVSTNKNPHVKLIKGAIDHLFKEEATASFFFETKHGLKEVFPYDVYSKAIEFIKNECIDLGNDIKEIQIYDKKYRFKFL